MLQAFFARPPVCTRGALPLCETLMPLRARVRAYMDPRARALLLPPEAYLHLSFSRSLGSASLGMYICIELRDD